MSISMRAAVIKEKASRRKKDLNRAKSSSEAESKSNGRRKSVEMRSITSNTLAVENDNSSSNSNSNSCATSSGATGEHGSDGLSGNGTGTGRWEEGNAKERGITGRVADNENAEFSSGSDVESGYDEGFEDFEEGAARRGSLALGDDDEEGEGREDMSSEERLEMFCRGDVRDPAMDPSVKVWLVIARCDGGSGQLLGQAVATGLDGIRAWICAVLLFSSRSTRDTKMPPSASSLYECTNELLVLTDTLHTELCSDASIQLLRRSFVLLAKRAKDCAQGVKKGLFGGGEKGFLAGKSSVGSSLASLASWGNASFISRISLSTSSLLSSVNTSASTPVLNPETPMKGKEKGKKEDAIDEESHPTRTCHDVHDFIDNESYISSLEDGTHLFRADGKGQGQGQGQGQGGEPLFLSGAYSEALVPMSGVKIGVGNVIPLHNGHNGWPSEAELASLTDLILLAGFPAECNLSGKNQSQDFSDKQKRRGAR